MSRVVTILLQVYDQPLPGVSARSFANGRHVSSEEEATRAVAGESAELAHAYLELHVLSADGGERWLTFPQPVLELGSIFPDGAGWRATVAPDSVLFHSPDHQANWHGQSVSQAELQAGESLELGTTRIWVVDARRPELASLESHAGLEFTRLWSLRPQAYRVGRRSVARHNHIEIAHPTVSRAQATLLPADQGRFALLSESETSPTLVNGRRLQAQEMAVLHHGDLVQFGDVSLRFRQAGRQALATKSLSVFCLGRFHVQWGQLELPETAWKVEKARWLLARLAWSWGQPVSTDVLMEMLWPDFPALRGRKNLSQCLVALKHLLQLNDDDDGLLLRTPSSLQLNANCLADHDAYLVKRLAAGSEPAGWEKALSLYQGPYLPSSFEEWVLLIRQELHQLVLAAAARLARHYRDQDQWAACLQAAQRGLQWDPCHQDLALHSMESCLQLGRFDAAVRTFEQVKKHLQQELEVEPSTDLLRAYHRAKLEMP